MSFGSFFNTLFAKAEAVIQSVEPVATPLIHLAEEAAPVVKAIVPQAAPVIDTITAAKNSITAVAPNAVNDATSAIALAKQTAADIGPTLLALEQAISNLFHVEVTAQSVVLTPKTTAATVPAVPASAPAPAAS